MGMFPGLLSQSKEHAVDRALDTEADHAHKQYPLRVIRSDFVVVAYMGEEGKYPDNHVDERVSKQRIELTACPLAVASNARVATN